MCLAVRVLLSNVQGGNWSVAKLPFHVMLAHYEVLVIHSYSHAFIPEALLWSLLVFPYTHTPYLHTMYTCI